MSRFRGNSIRHRRRVARILSAQTPCWAQTSPRCALVGMGDSTTEARGRSWRLVLAPWFEAGSLALRSPPPQTAISE